MSEDAPEIYIRYGEPVLMENWEDLSPQVREAWLDLDAKVARLLLESRRGD